MSDMLSIGASGLRAYQTALTTVSENIANAGSPGYSKRVANIREVAAASSPMTGTINGLGSAVSGVSRAGDMFRAAEVRTASSDLARTEAGATWLERIEGALSGDRLGDRLTQFFTSARAVAADPSAVAPRAAMLEAASSVAASFAATGNALAGAAAELDASADAAVTQLNGLAAALAKVNAGLGRTAPGSSGSASLLDQRDQLLESMSALTDVDVSLDGVGRALVRVGGASGPVLVQGDSAATVTYVRGDEGQATFAAHRDGQVTSFAPFAGALSGMADGAQRIATARADIDALSGAFANGVNAVQAQGRDLNGTAGAPMFEIGDPASQLTLSLVDPRGIAAAGVGGGMRDNSNLSALEGLRGSGGYETRVTDMVTTNAAALVARRTVSEAQTSIRDSAVASRDAASGVNLDEEAVDLLRFQQAYQASSRVIQIARETFQSILDIR
jgi:flagellar hook-associated protein 1